LGETGENSQKVWVFVWSGGWRRFGREKGDGEGSTNFLPMVGSGRRSRKLERRGSVFLREKRNQCITLIIIHNFLYFQSFLTMVICEKKNLIQHLPKHNFK
jgi:hypothetical protein